MNDTAKQEIILFDKNDIIVFNEFKSQLEQLKSDSEKIIPDLTTKKGIDAEVSYIYKIKKSKAALDRVRKSEKENSLEYGREVDKQAGEIRAELQTIIETREKPIQEMKDKAEARDQAIKDKIESLNEYKIVGSGADSAVYVDLLEKVERFQVDDSLEEFKAEAQLVKDSAITYLKNYIEERQKYEAEQVELEELRQEKEQREAKEEEDRIARVAQEESDRIALEAKQQAERDEKIRKENLELDRIQAQNNKMLIFTNYKTHSLENIDVGAFEALLKEMREMELTEEDWDKDFLSDAALAQSRAIIGIQEAIDKRKKYDADQVELKRLQEEAAENQRQQEADHQEQLRTDRETVAAKKKSDNKAHQKKINNGVEDAMVKLGTSKHVAKTIVDAIAKGEIPNVSIFY